LSAAFAIVFGFRPFAQVFLSVRVDFYYFKVKIKVGGQECPPTPSARLQ
jgi:hypothetical protein